MEPLRILHVVEASFAGVGRHVLDLVEGCSALGDSVDVVYSRTRASADFVNRIARSPVRAVHTVSAPRFPGPADVAALASIARFARRNGPYDVVHGHASKGGVYSRLVLDDGAVRVYTPNALVTQSPTLGRIQRRLFAAVEYELARRTDGLVYVSQDEADHGHRSDLSPRDERVIPNGIPMPALPTRLDARDALGLPTDTVVIGFVGRLDAQKGLDRLIDAVARLDRPDVLLAVIGEGTDGDALRRRAAAAGIAARVLWLGTRPGQASMPAFDVVALPSRYEGFPYVALEALWAGVPVVATDRCGLNRLRDDPSVIVVDGTDAAVVGALAAALDAEIRRVLDRACDRDQRIADARRTVSAYSVEEMVRSTRAFYVDLVAGRDRSLRRGSRR